MKMIRDFQDISNYQIEKATPEAQVAYLRKVVNIKNQEIEDLKVLLETARLERKLEDRRVTQEINALVSAKKLIEQSRPTPKKRWWRRG